MRPALFLVLVGGAAAFSTHKGDPCDCPQASTRQSLDCSDAAKEGRAQARQARPTATGPNGTASTNLQRTWELIGSNTQSHGFMNPIETLLYAQNLTYIQQMELINSDNRGDSHEKISHGIGGHAKAHFNWNAASSRYSGMFQRADHCLIRIANAAEPAPSSIVNPTSYNPNMAVKCFTDGGLFDSHANLQFIWEIDGYNVIPAGKQHSCSFFDVPLANHCGRRDNISMALRDIFIGAFEKADPSPLMLGTSQFGLKEQSPSQLGGDGSQFPFALVLSPNPALSSIPCDTTFQNFTSQLTHSQMASMVGQTLYEVFAVHDPWTTRPAGHPDLVHIGDLVLDSPFTTSMFGDTALFFQHTFMAEEIERVRAHNTSRADAWHTYSAPAGTPGSFVKEEGAAWYWPFLPAFGASSGAP